MPALNDGTCPKCHRRFGWEGEVVDRPPCPECGFEIPKKELEETEKLLEEMRRKMLEED